MDSKDTRTETWLAEELRLHEGHPLGLTTRSVAGTLGHREFVIINLYKSA